MRTLATTVAIAAALFVLAYNPQPAQADDLRQAWGEAYNLLKRNPEAVDDTVTAIERLEGLLDHDRAIELLEFFDECDKAWDAAMGEKDVPKGAEERPFDAYKIANAILEAVRTMTDGEEAAEFEDELNETDDYSLRPRMAMMDAIGNNADHEDCLKVLKAVAKNEDGKQDTDMRILAVYYLSDRSADNEVFSIIAQCLKDPSWRIRDISIEAMQRAADHHEDQAILALINALANEQGKLRKALADALEDITGADNGTDPDAWIDWFKNKKREDQGLPPKSGKGDRGTRVRVFKTESFSDRYVFLLDTSISMTERITPEEKERLKKSITSGPGDEKDPRRPLDWSEIHCKLDLAREEMIRSLEVMDPERTMFTVITFADTVKVWKDELVPTDEDNIEDVAKYLRGLKGQKKTNVFGALDAAYDLSEELAGVDTKKRKKKKKKDDGKVYTGDHPDDSIPDTIYIYTDGYATFGKYAGDDKGWQGKSPQEKAKLYSAIMKEMIKEVKDRNRIARITLNCIGVGSPQDSHTLRDLAKAGNGEYVPIGK